jgi:hypothetical protein
MKENIEKMTFEDYYLSLRDASRLLREQICNRLEISHKTFYNKRNDNSWSTIERETISQLLKKSVDVLFPEKQTS